MGRKLHRQGFSGKEVCFDNEITNRVYCKYPAHVIYEHIRHTLGEDMPITPVLYEEYSHPMNNILGREAVPKSEETINMNQRYEVY